MENFENKNKKEQAQEPKQRKDLFSGDKFQKPAGLESVKDEYPTTLNLDKDQEEALRQEILKALEDSNSL